MRFAVFEKCFVLIVSLLGECRKIGFAGSKNVLYKMLAGAFVKKHNDRLTC
jgi:hypothetical protein